MNGSDTSHGNGAEVAPSGFAALTGRPDHEIMSEAELAALLGKDISTIKRAIERGELPRSARVMGKPLLTIGEIRAHIAKLISRAAEEADRVRSKVHTLKPSHRN